MILFLWLRLASSYSLLEEHKPENKDQLLLIIGTKMPCVLKFTIKSALVTNNKQSYL